MYVRDAVPSDGERAMEVLARVAEEGLIATEPPVDVPARAERFREGLAAGSTRSWMLCDDDDEIVGLLGLHETKTEGVLGLGVSIAAAHRGAGGGRMLIERALRWAREQSPAHKIELEVWPENEKAIALYEALGFEHEGFRRNHYRRRDGSLRSAVLMAIAVGD